MENRLRLINGKKIKIGYTNYKGEYSEREIIPEFIWYGSTEWHPVEQWLMRAVDVSKMAERNFALGDMKLLI